MQGSAASQPDGTANDQRKKGGFLKQEGKTAFTGGVLANDPKVCGINIPPKTEEVQEEEEKDRLQ